MTSKRLYYILVGIVCLLVAGLIGGAYGADTILRAQSQNVIKARSHSMALQQQQSQLASAKASIAKYQQVANVARSIVPQDKDQAQAVREIVKIANENGVKLGTITFPTSTLGSKAVAAGNSSGSSAPSGSSSGAAASATPSAGSDAAAKLSQLKPAAGIPGVYTLQITVQSDNANPAPYDKFIAFLAGLEHNRRTALVNTISVQPDAADSSKVSFNIIIDEYIKP